MSTTVISPHSPTTTVNERIDKCLSDSSTLERKIWTVLTVIVFVGVAVAIYGLAVGKDYLIGIGASETGIAYWPIRTLIQLYRRRIALSVIPAITSLLTQRDAAREIHALVEHLLD